MIPLLLAVGIFLAFWTIGLAVLVAVRADTNELRVVLAAPALGSAFTLIPLFGLSHAGLAMNDVAIPVVAVLLIASAMVLVIARAHIPITVAPVGAICAVSLVLTGWPMLRYGFRWLANANDDMANYVLLAKKLMDNGLLAPLDVAALLSARGYETAIGTLHIIGARPGGEIMLAALSSVTGRAPYETFMPLILAFHLCAICGAAALAMQASRHWCAAAIAAVLLAASPLATFGVVQQLLPQVWSLGLATALLALLTRAELHRSPGARLKDIVPSGVLVAALVVAYVELASTLTLVYLLYVGVLAARRKLDWSVLRLWVPVIAITALVVNEYLIREFFFVRSQASTGFKGGAGLELFGYALVPTALPGLFGLQLQLPHPAAFGLQTSIAIALVLLAGVLIGSILSARQGVAASMAVLVYMGFGVIAAFTGSAFAVFKLQMYFQPFLAATVGVWFARVERRRPLLLVGAGLLAMLLSVQLITQRTYVSRSQSPVDLRNASAEELLPFFRKVFAAADRPVIAVTENPTLAKLEAASIEDRRLYFVSARSVARVPSSGAVRDRDLREAIQELRRRDVWRLRAFDLHDDTTRRANPFEDNTHASALLSSGRCQVVMPTGSQTIVNRRSLPEGSQALVSRPCGANGNKLVFTASTLGPGYYLPTAQSRVAFYQLEPDYFYPGRTFSGFGRYALFRVLEPSSRVRLEIDLTTSLSQDGVNLLPPTSVVGVGRTRLGLLGRGSAHVFSPTFSPQMIDGQPYVLLDLGVDGRIRRDLRSGLKGLYRRSIPLDSRSLTSYVRNISLLSESEYRKLKAPSSVQHFPADLADPNLQYSGIYEDGWTGERSYLVLAGGDKADLVLRAEALSIPGQRLQVLVNGRGVASREIAAGALSLRVPIAASSARRRVELRWTGAIQLSAQDRRRAAALLDFIGVVPRSGG